MKKIGVFLWLVLAVIGLGNLPISKAAPAGIVYREGTHFYLDGKPAFNGTIAVDGTVNFGFNLYSGTNVKPTGFT